MARGNGIRRTNEDRSNGVRRTSDSRSNGEGKKKSSRLGRWLYAMLCLLILGAFALLISSQANRYNALRAQNDRWQEELSRAVAVYEDLHYQMAYFDTDAYIERLARERLGWVLPNEIVFRKITD